MLKYGAIAAAVLLCGLSAAAQGQNRGLPSLRDGDVVSADVLNDVFQRIDNVTVGIANNDELVGTWQFTIYTLQPNNDPNYVLDASGAVWTKSDSLTFTNNGDGTYSFATTRYTLHPGNATVGGESGRYHVIDSRIFLSPTTRGPQKRTMAKFSPDRFAWDDVNDSYLVMQRAEPPPAIPTDLSATLEGSQVTLTWTDPSDAETGFRVFRKDTLRGNYLQLTVVGPNVTSYVDTLPGVGSHWYRVSAVNDAGDSIGSNVVKISNEPVTEPQPQ